MFIHDERPCAGLQHAEAFEELDNCVLLCRGQRLKSLAGSEGFSCVREDGLPQRGVPAVMEVGRFTRCAPKTFCQEPRVPSEEEIRSGSMLHVERLRVRVIRSAADVVQFQICERWNMDHPV